MKTIVIMALALQLTSLAKANGNGPTPTPAPKVELTTVVVNDENENLVATFTGNTLYVFDLDQGKKVPACNADCAEVWPPYLVNVAEKAKLVAPLGTIARANGKLQLTYEGRPVYTYAFDRHAADDQGDGLGDVWHYIELAQVK